MVSPELAQAFCLSQGDLYVGKAPHREPSTALQQTHSAHNMWGFLTEHTAIDHKPSLTQGRYSGREPLHATGQNWILGAWMRFFLL